MLKNSNFVKLRVAAPVASADKIRRVLHQSGAGVQGNYEACTGSFRQVGRFLPAKGAHPAIGEVGKIEAVEEEVIETLCEIGLVPKVIAAVKAVHPYEEPAIDIMPRLEIVE